MKEGSSFWVTPKEQYLKDINMLVYIDESGYRQNWIFVAVKILDEKNARLCVKKWRQYVSSVSSKLNINEYRDSKTPDRQRRIILNEIASRSYMFWVLHFFNYKSHKQDYSKAITQLLMEVDLSDVNLIVLDKVERSWKHMEKHIETIRRGLSYPQSIKWGDSEQEKGIQVADAICGAAAKKYNNFSSASYFEIIEHLCQGYKKY